MINHRLEGAVMAKKGFSLWGLAVLVLAAGLLGLMPAAASAKVRTCPPFHLKTDDGKIINPTDLRGLPQLRRDHQGLSFPAGLGPRQGRFFQVEALGAVRRHDGQVLTAIFSPVGEKAE
jgi:hypothetical protein